MLTVENLSCRRNQRTLFRDLSFTVATGGFLRVTGANGSGKSSLLRILAGLIEPASGRVQWDGSAPALTHYIGHLDAVKPALTVREMIAYWACLRGVDVDMSAVCAAFGMDVLVNRPIRALSAGQKRRLSLSRLMLDNAPLWLLDEPTVALDSDGRDLLFAQIARHRAAGGIVIAATHEKWDVPDTQNLQIGAP